MSRVYVQKVTIDLDEMVIRVRLADIGGRITFLALTADEASNLADELRHKVDVASRAKGAS